MRLTTLTHVDTSRDAAGASLLSFHTERPLQHAAGQFGVWLCGGALSPFTIASAPDDEHVQLGTHVHPGSAVKRKLAVLRPGDRVRMIGPIGHVAPPEDGRPIIFAAQGMGVTVARSLLRSPATRERTLLHVGAPYFRDELAAFANRSVHTASRSAFAIAMKDQIRASPDAHYVVSGSTAFVRAVSQTLRRSGVTGSSVHTDRFLGLPDRDLF